MDKSTFYRTGRIAQLSGLVGILAVGLLIAALAAPTPAADSMRRETSLFAWQNAAVVFQALAMVPVTLGVSQLFGKTAPMASRRLLLIGLVGQITLILAAGLLLTGTVSDMLYMAPIGLVGLWVLLVSKSNPLTFPRGVRWLGLIAGSGLSLIGLGFILYGAFVAPAVFVRPLTSAEIDAQSLTTPNLIAHLCMAAGTPFGRVLYPIWTLALGVRMIRLSQS